MLNFVHALEILGFGICHSDKEWYQLTSVDFAHEMSANVGSPDAEFDALAKNIADSVAVA